MKIKNTVYTVLAGASLLCVLAFWMGIGTKHESLQFSTEPLAKTVIQTATEEDRAQRAVTWAADVLFGFLLPEGE